MANGAKSFFSTPDMGDEARNRIAQTLHLFLFLTLASAIVSAFTDIVRDDIGSAAIAAAIGVTSVGLWALMRFGRVGFAAMSFAILTAAGATGMALLDEGIHDQVIILYPLAVTFAAFVLSRFTFAFLTLVVLALANGVVWAEMSGAITTNFSATTGVNDMVDISMVIILFALIAGLMTRDLRRSLDRAVAATTVLQVNQRAVSTLLSHLPGMVYRYGGGLSGKMEFVSESSKRLLGLEVSAIKGKTSPPYVFLPIPEDRAETKRAVDAAIAADRTYAVEYRTKVNNGTKWLWDTGTALRDANGKFIAVEGYVTDITAKRLYEDALIGREGAVRHAFSDILDAATQGKLVLKTRTELFSLVGQPVSEPFTVSGFEQLAASRRFLESVIGHVFGDCFGRSTRPLVAYGEAVANAIKYGGSCEVRVYKSRPGKRVYDDPAASAMQVRVTDNGNGIDFGSLPKNTVITGEGAKLTLGMGFQIMLDGCDRLYLASDKSGTTLVLEFACVSA